MGAGNSSSRWKGKQNGKEGRGLLSFRVGKGREAARGGAREADGNALHSGGPEEISGGFFEEISGGFFRLHYGGPGRRRFALDASPAMALLPTEGGLELVSSSGFVGFFQPP